MLIGIQPDQIGKQSYSDKWTYYLDEKNIDFELIDIYNIENLSSLLKYDGIMWRWGLDYPERLFAPKILDVIEEELKIPVYPSRRLRMAWDDKIKQNLIFKANNIKTPQTWIFYKKDDALSFVKQAKFPLVFKLSSGASSSGVTLIRNKEEAQNVISRMFGKGIESIEQLDDIKKNQKTKSFLRMVKGKIINSYKYSNRIALQKCEKSYVIFQEFLENNQYDTRVTVINGKAYAFRRLVRENDFRASGSGKIDFNYEKIDVNMIKKGFEISDKLNADCMAYDFVYDQGEIKLLEMCWTFADWAIEKCPVYWTKNLKRYSNMDWPQKTQVDYFVSKIKSLKK